MTPTTYQPSSMAAACASSINSPRKHFSSMFLHLLLLVNIIMASETETRRWPCGQNHCVCSQGQSANIPSSDVTKQSGVHAVCHVQTVTSYKSILHTLSPSLEALSIICDNSNSTGPLRWDMFEQYPDMQELRIENCKINFIETKFPNVLQNLSMLEFSKTVLPIFNPKTFSGFQSLSNFKIDHSKLSSFPPFMEIKELRTLNISYNQIDSPTIVIPNDINSTLPNLIDVDFSANGIVSIPSELFPLSPNLQYLSLKSNKISRITLPQGFVLHHLKSFDANWNPLQHIDFNAFMSSTSLTKFRITGSNNMPLVFDGEYKLPNLQDLKISNFKLNSSVWDVFDLPGVTKVDFSRNSIANLMLQKLTSLQVLQVQENNISQLSPATFSNQTHIKAINISHNEIRELPETLFTSKYDLRLLDLSANRIGTLEYRIFKTNINLIYLDLSHNSISRLPYTLFSKNQYISVLFLQNNMLKFLPGILNLKKLTNLNISHNYLKFLFSRTFAGLESLEVLEASDNLFARIPTSLLSRCPNLLSANFDNNQISSLGSFQDHPNLIKIQLQNNSLTDIISESPFIGMKSLRFIFLDNNQFTLVRPDMFPPSIEFISMSVNNITRLLYGSLDNLPNLLVINLMQSRALIQIPQLTVQKYTRLGRKPEMYLGYTYLYCSCNLGYLKAWDEARHLVPELKARFPKFQGLENAKCESPFFPGEARPFKSVPLSQFVCEYNETLCFDLQCDCCRHPPSTLCSCELTCPEECQCFEGGSSYYQNYVHINCQRRNLTAVPTLIPSMATNIYLDGNSLKSLFMASFASFTHAKELHLNHSNIVYIEDGTFDNMIALKLLRLNNNKIGTIRNETFAIISGLTFLDLSNNEIESLDSGSFHNLINLEILKLHNNRLATIGAVLDIPSLHSVTLAFNPWTCDCNSQSNIYIYLLTLRDIVKDRNEVCCRFLSKMPDSYSLYAQSTLQVLGSHAENSTDNISYNSSTLISDHNKNVQDNNTREAFSTSPIEIGEYHYKTTSQPPDNDRFSNRKINEQLSTQKEESQGTGDTPLNLHNNPEENGNKCITLLSFDFDHLCTKLSDVTGSTILSPTSSNNEVNASLHITIGLLVSAAVVAVLAFLVAGVVWRRRKLQALLKSTSGHSISIDETEQEKQEDTALGPVHS